MRHFKYFPFFLLLFIAFSCSPTFKDSIKKMKSIPAHGAYIDKSAPLAVIDYYSGHPLGDAIQEKLLGLGFNIVDRTALTKIIDEVGFDLNEMRKRVFQLNKGAHAYVNVENIVIVDGDWYKGDQSKNEHDVVYSANIKIVNVKTGSILLMFTYEQIAPQETKGRWIWSPNCRYETAEITINKIINEIEKLVKK